MCIRDRHCEESVQAKAQVNDEIGCALNDHAETHRVAAYLTKETLVGDPPCLASSTSRSALTWIRSSTRKICGLRGRGAVADAKWLRCRYNDCNAGRRRPLTSASSSLVNYSEYLA